MTTMEDSEPDVTSSSVSSSSSSSSNAPPSLAKGSWSKTTSTTPTPTASTNDLEAWLSKLRLGTPLTEAEVKLLCDMAREVFFNESNVHGQ